MGQQEVAAGLFAGSFEPSDLRGVGGRDIDLRAIDRDRRARRCQSPPSGAHLARNPEPRGIEAGLRGIVHPARVSAQRLTLPGQRSPADTEPSSSITPCERVSRSVETTGGPTNGPRPARRSAWACALRAGRPARSDDCATAISTASWSVTAPPAAGSVWAGADAGAVAMINAAQRCVIIVFAFPALLMGGQSSPASPFHYADAMFAPQKF
nr:hypothetical protein [Hankyongella ginsenosidimutans]